MLLHQIVGQQPQVTHTKSQTFVIKPTDTASHMINFGWALAVQPNIIDPRTQFQAAQLLTYKHPSKYLAVPLPKIESGPNFPITVSTGRVARPAADWKGKAMEQVSCDWGGWRPFPACRLHFVCRGRERERTSPHKVSLSRVCLVSAGSNDELVWSKFAHSLSFADDQKPAVLFCSMQIFQKVALDAFQISDCLSN